MRPLRVRLGPAEVVEIAAPALVGARRHAITELRVELSGPLERHRTGGGERLGLSLDAHSLFKTKAQAKLAVEMVDDRGHPVIDAVVSPRLRMLPGAEGVQTLELTTPEKLADGYYTVRATGAAIAADESTENVVQMYLRRENGEFFSISYEEYIAKSRALLEVAAQ